MEKNLEGRLSLGIAEFKDLVNSKKIYVDKTQFIKKLLDLGYKYYFLSRPRRFGKTLFVSTLESFFQGEKELFKNTFIYDNWEEWDKYPILRISMSNPLNSSPEELVNEISREIDRLGKLNSLKLNKNDSYTSKFRDLIQELSEKNKKEVVVLIDEYDAPILDHFNNTTLASGNRKILQDFYNVLKNEEKFLKFVFITGISKFTKTSIFSKFNNFTELSLDKRFATICGITQEELEKNYEENIENLAKQNNLTYDEAIEKIKYFYDGYSWNGKERVYNPNSTLRCLDLETFTSFWFLTGTPSFIAEIFKKKKVNTDYFKPTILNESELDAIDPENINETTLLFQSGYLTIEKVFFQDNKVKYSLKIPNQEVEEAFRENLLKLYIKDANNPFIKNQEAIWKDLMNGDCKKLSQDLRAFITGIPYYNRITMGNDEKWKVYSTIFTIWGQQAGFNFNVETAVEDGRIDFVLEKSSKEETLIVEMKFTQNQSKSIESLVNEGLKQIKDKKYYWAHTGNVKLLGLGLKDIKIKDGYITDVKCKIEDAPKD